MSTALLKSTYLLELDNSTLSEVEKRMREQKNEWEEKEALYQPITRYGREAIWCWL